MGENFVCGIPYRGGGVFGFFTFLRCFKPFVYRCFRVFGCKFLLVSLLAKVKVKKHLLPYLYIMFRFLYILGLIVKKCINFAVLGKFRVNHSQSLYLSALQPLCLLCILFPIYLIHAQISSKSCQKIGIGN